ncbi:hypothetical protein BDV96DRAFT_119810 [Lophiotrema nucula]|uniref:Uncharacterized protein n=1 Tax=Lophiotrema nucula TaxID=690887 RepID=A0A6A5Z1I1_9PLEO|nr:hypothetical protein BDV96DRAFT_119810 [Lophiotrema nucula]
MSKRIFPSCSNVRLCLLPLLLMHPSKPNLLHLPFFRKDSSCGWVQRLLHVIRWISPDCLAILVVILDDREPSMTKTGRSSPV